jgi:ADP-ribose pyrophosphatase YjhB (NUDIX family)
MITPVSGQWKIRTVEGTAVPTPYVSTSGFAVDADGFFPLLYRGPNVRSAKNCWSLPSGLHECGLTLSQQFSTELREELEIEAVNDAVTLGTYENIAAVDSWHWVIVVMATRVKTLKSMVNKEPDKHPEIRKVHWGDIGSSSFLGMDWAPGLREFLTKNNLAIRAAISDML